MKRAAIYRILYGEDFIVESIESILPHVDRVFVVIAPRPWGTSTGVTYKGEWVSWPAKFDGVRDRVLGMDEPRVGVLDDFWPTPAGQYEHIVNDLIAPHYSPDEILIMEPDWVFSEQEAASTIAKWTAHPELKSACARQVELWRTPTWRIQDRGFARPTPTLHRQTGGEHGALPSLVHNLGFCFSESTMRWKHLTAIAFSAEIRDCAPNPDWYEKTWLHWHPGSNNRNLEIALTLEHCIPSAFPYNIAGLPAS